jgi:hypothetical protein
MKRFILGVAVLATLQACQDTTSPPAVPSDASSPTTRVDASAASLTAPQLWANVNASGTLARGSRVTGVTHLGPGQYEVTFNRNVSQCAYVATTRVVTNQALQVYTASGHLSANGVFVEVKNQGGGLQDGPFNLVTTCGTQQAIRFAVVGYTANLVRATAGTSLSHPGQGQYYVRFSSAVPGCSYIATVGDPANALVFAPSGVYTGSGPNANTVYIETKNPGGGLQDGVPFHLALICPSTGTLSRFAVVRSIGTAQRASPGTSSTRTATGRYTITSNRNLTTCATVATRGSVNTSVPFSPATVEITPGPNSRSIRIHVRKLLFFDPNTGFTSQSFHAAMIC